MFNFNFGKKKPDKKQLIIVSVIVSGIIALLSQCTGLSENGVWDLLDEVQRKYFPQTILNDIIILDESKIKRRVERDVNKAVQQVIPEYDMIIGEYEKHKPKYIEEKNDESLCYTDECKTLAPPMRICAPWVNDCE